MRAFTLDSFDVPPALRDDLAEPHPGDDELLVRVHASSVNPVDVFIAAGALKGVAEYEFPVINVGDHYLPAVVLAKTIGYASGTSTHALSVAELTHAINGLAPAEAGTTMDHPNLRASREILAEVESNPYRGVVAVFIRDLDDPVSSEADGSLRTQLPD